MSELLTLSNLVVSFSSGRAVNGASLLIRPGELTALVGESGSGKSMTALSLLGLLPEVARRTGGKAMFEGQDIFALSAEQLNDLRGKRIAMIFQEPMTALNPVLTIGCQIGEVLRQHEALGGKALRERILALLKEVGIPEPAQRMGEYPHQLSGGMRQRVMIAMAIACRPALLIADEPTTALDVTVQAQIMELLARLRRERNTAVLLITHNLVLVRKEADLVSVMYAGRIVEQAPTAELFRAPRHPYTKMLLQAVPRVSARGTPLQAIPGQVPPLSELTGTACSFAHRCPAASAECLWTLPPLRSIAGDHFCACLHPVPADNAVPAETEARPPEGKEASALLPLRLAAHRLQVLFPVRKGLFSSSRECVHAVDTVDLELHAGETLALVGESGCGKTTVGKALIRLVKTTGGTILVPDREVALGSRRIQMIFQDPFSSLDPRLMVGESIAEGLDSYGIAPGEERIPYINDILQKVGLSADARTRYPHQFSGGQRQRIGLARAIAVRPDILVCDECTSALDVSVQAQILNLLKQLQKELGLAYLFITHDLSVVSYLADRIAIMYLGQIVEQGTVQEILQSARHPYTQALLASSPSWKTGGAQTQAAIKGEVPSPIHLPPGCRFHPRCPKATPACREGNCPDLRPCRKTHLVRCPLATL